MRPVVMQVPLTWASPGALGGSPAALMPLWGSEGLKGSSLGCARACVRSNPSTGRVGCGVNVAVGVC